MNVKKAVVIKRIFFLFLILGWCISNAKAGGTTLSIQEYYDVLFKININQVVIFPPRNVAPLEGTVYIPPFVSQGDMPEDIQQKEPEVRKVDCSPFDSLPPDPQLPNVSLNFPLKNFSDSGVNSSLSSFLPKNETNYGDMGEESTDTNSTNPLGLTRLSTKETIKTSFISHVPKKPIPEEVFKLAVKYKKDWKKIFDSLEREYGAWIKDSKSDIKNNFRLYESNKYKKGKKYTSEENKKILDSVKRHGQDWLKIGAFFPERSPFSLRNRYYNTLKSTKNSKKYNPRLIEEDLSKIHVNDIDPKDLIKYIKPHLSKEALNTNIKNEE